MKNTPKYKERDEVKVKIDYYGQEVEVHGVITYVDTYPEEPEYCIHIWKFQNDVMVFEKDIIGLIK